VIDRDCATGLGAIEGDDLAWVARY
jgi:hypothetical protein